MEINADADLNHSPNSGHWLYLHFSSTEDNFPHQRKVSHSWNNSRKKMSIDFRLDFAPNDSKKVFDLPTIFEKAFYLILRISQSPDPFDSSASANRKWIHRRIFMNMRASRGYDSSLELFFPSSLDLRIVSGLLIALITRCNMDQENNYLFVIVFVSSQQCCLRINLSYVQYRTTCCLHEDDWGLLLLGEIRS